MKICLINNLYKPFARGGAEKVVEIAAQELKNRGNDVFIICVKPYFSNQPKISEHDGVRVYYLSSLYLNLHKISVFLRIFWHLFDMYDFITAWKIKKILLDEKAEMAITNNLKGVSYLAPKVIKKLGIKHVHILHDIQLIHPSGLMSYKEEYKVKGDLTKVYYRMSRKLFDSPDLVVAPSKWLLDFHLENKFFKKSKIKVVYNPLGGYNAAVPLVVRRAEKGKIFRFLYVGQIEHHKGIFLLLKSFKTMLERYKTCELTIVGSGSKLEMIKNKTGGIKNIKIAGKKNKDEVRGLMVNSDCLIVPSLCYENSPSVIYEAISSGTHVLASNIGGIPELLDFNKDFLFIPNAKELVRKMTWVSENREELAMMGEKLKRKIKNYNAEYYIDSIIDF